ncbi:MAG TPA: hypothetical protein VJ725_01135 [Thermoanaerobaculia bacterium]|nr:hypothetical protein [Thermoanaerobaculia bacterium]
MPEEYAPLPLVITPEELEKAEIAVLLDFLRENAARHDVSELREQALAVGYRASVVDRAIADFYEELRSFVETASDPVPEPPPVCVEEKPRPAASPVPVPPPPRVPVFVQTLAAAEKEEMERQARLKGFTSGVIALLIVLLNAVLLIPAFTGKGDVSVLAYSAEIGLALVLSGLQKMHAERRVSNVPIASAVRAEPERSPVPTLPHEVRTETPDAPRVPQRMQSRD